ncbi:MAG: hypothetical protein IE909_04965 [Campylobacterales bacterium]|nr:hypothetical protein [Campylobacterales bacterium]
MTKNNCNLKLPDYIKNLQIDLCRSNLDYYTYHDRYLKKLQRLEVDKLDPHYLSTYSSFVGELYENIIYELLLRYALETHTIKEFVLKGPHQKKSQNFKNGFMCDINSQIVYKSGYKDITEFDGLFFTQNDVYFVESTIVKTTTGLRKRLKKKKALLQILFPKKNIKALIILSEGALGVSVFPKYCTVWITKSLDDEQLIDQIIHASKPSESLVEFESSKLIQAKDIKTTNFKYFETLAWILRKSVDQKNGGLNYQFLLGEEIDLYFDIYTKLYVGYTNVKDFIQLLKLLEIQTISEDIDLSHIIDQKVYITTEKENQKLSYVFYVQVKNDGLKKLELLVDDKILKVSSKDPKGFTVSEVKFVKYILNKKNLFHFELLKGLQNLVD